VADAVSFRRLRLEALQKYPDSFGSTYEIEAAKPLEHFVERLQRNSVFGELVGIIGFYQQSGPKDQHKGFIWGMLHGNTGSAFLPIRGCLRRTLT
jgi:hypothetical protein